MMGAVRRPVVAVVTIVAIVAPGCRYTSDLRLPDDQAVSSQVLWSDGTPLTTLHAQEDREPVSLAAMAPAVPKAVVAIEDERFFDHDGVDARGVVRALTRDIQQGNLAEGGSTITQQYVRAVMLGPEKDLERKLREAVMAVQIERRYSKRTILERYLNTVYFGNGAYGVQAAARRYFGRDVRDLDLAQAALLAGMIRAPETYNPYTAPGRTRARRNAVLDRLEHLGRASPAEVARARAQPLVVASDPTKERYPAPFFVEQVRKFILSHEAFGATTDQRRRLLLEGGLRIRTSLDHRLQDLAEQATSRVIAAPATDPAAALVALDPTTGQVKAYVGGPDYFGDAPWARLDLAGGGCRGDGKGCRQAGSTFKPFVLAAALDAGMPLTRTYDAPGSLTIPIPGEEPWLVNNYDGNGRGRMDLKEATVQSVNTVYAQLVMELGAQSVVDVASRMGVRSPLLAVPSAALGTNGVTPLDMAAAYGTLADDGMRAEPVFVTKVARRDGTVLYDATVRRSRVLPAATARTITGVLEEVVNRGTGVNARIGRPVAGKTGTGEEWQDAWFVGYTPELVAAVWVGFPDAQRTMRPPATRITVTGGSWPAQIWQLFAGAALAETPAHPFPTPEASGAGVTTTTGPSGPRVVSVEGMSISEASRALIDAGYRPRLRTRKSRDYPPGTIMSQEPAAGAAARPGSTVTIIVADGPPPTNAVPSVLGAYADEAAATLRAAGFVTEVLVGPEPPPGNPARAGRVWKQSPISGAVLDEGETVRLTVNP